MLAARYGATVAGFVYVLSLIAWLSVLLSPTVWAGPVPAPPKIKAKSWLLLDHHSGFVMAEHNADERLEPASLTKILTTYVVFAQLRAGKIAPDDQVLISAKAWKMAGSRMFIEVDKRVSVDDLLRGVIIQSGNDASVALAEHVAGSESAFAELMNQYAVTLGMTGSQFMNASGLPDPDHYTTARDMALLASALIRDFPELYPIHAEKEFVFNNIPQANRNRLLWSDPSVDGLKTGHTEAAGYCLVASARRDGMRLISVLMGASSERTRAEQSRSLLAYGFRFYETHRLYAANSVVQDVRIYKGSEPSVALGFDSDLHVTVPRGQYDKLVPVMELRSQIEAPVVVGDVRGELRVELDGEPVARRDLTVLKTVPKGSLWRQLIDSARMLID